MQVSPLRTLTAAILALAFGATLALADDEAVYVHVGAKQTVELPDMAESVNIPDGGIVDVTRGDTKKVLIVSGLQAGSVRMEVELKDGRKLQYDVTVTDPGSVSAALALVNGIPGLSAEVRGDKVVVGGRVSSPSAQSRLAGAKRSYPGIIVDGSETQMPSNNTIVQTINNVLNENDLGNVQAVAYGRLIALQGSPRDEQQQELALRIAKMIYPDIEDRTSKTSNGAPPISIEVMFIEMQKKNDLQAGFNGGLGDTLRNTGSDDAVKSGGDAKGDAPTPGIAGMVGGGGGKFGRMQWQVGALTSFLKLIEAKSVSRVLSNPKLVSRSGQEAKFHSGGTFYIESGRVVAGGVTTLEYQPVDYGIKLNILPKLDALGQIDSTIMTSIVDIGAKIADKESITKSEVTTAVTIKDGQSILLTGLMRKQEKKKVDRVPLLADIPIVGELFKSRRSQNEETELLVIVTMSRIQAVNERIKAADKLWDKAGEDVKFSVFD